MARLVYPQILEELIEDEVFQPPFIKLVPYKKNFKVTQTTDQEVETVDGTKKVSAGEISEDKIEKGFDNVTEIILPMPPQIVDSLSGNFQAVEGLGKIMKSGIGGYIKWKVLKGLGSFGGLLPQEIVMAIKSGIFGGGLDNPHEQLLYSGHNRRTFTLSYEDMKPVNREEENTLKNIIDVLKSASIGGYGDLVITAPPSWDIEFYSDSDTLILSYRNCKISDFNETMGGQNTESFSRMESGFPLTSLTITLNEMDFANQRSLKRYNKSYERE